MAAELDALRQRVAVLERELQQLRADAPLLGRLRSGLAQVAVAQRLAPPAEHQQLLELIVESAMAVLGADAGTLYELDEATQELVFRVTLGDYAVALRGQRLARGQGIAGLVALTGQAMGAANLADDPRWAQEIGYRVGYTPTTMLAVPLLLEDRVTGVLQLMDKKGGEQFSASDIATLGLFAQQAAIAIAQSQRLHALASLVRAVMVEDGAPMDLVDVVDTLISHTEQTPEYGETLRLAARVGELARRGDAGRRLALDVAEAMLRYVDAQVGGD